MPPHPEAMSIETETLYGLGANLPPRGPAVVGNLSRFWSCIDLTAARTTNTSGRGIPLWPRWLRAGSRGVHERWPAPTFSCRVYCSVTMPFEGVTQGKIFSVEAPLGEEVDTSGTSEMTHE